MSAPIITPDTRFSEDGGDVMYLRDVARLVATERRAKRLVLSGEIITTEAALKQHLTEKLAMHSTNVRKSFRKLDRDYSGCLDRYEFRRFLENLNIHTTHSVFNNVFSALDTDSNGTVEFGEFMKNFGPAIAGEELPIMMDGENRQLEKFREIVRNREARAGVSVFNMEDARKMLSLKLATMSNSVRKIFQHANTDFQQAHETEGGLNKAEFQTILDKFNIPMKEEEYDKLYNSLDPDESGIISYAEFQSAFGSDIYGGSSDIRWGATAVPKDHAVASKFSTLASAAERNASGPDVQSGGSLVADGTSGSLIQKEIQFNYMPSEYAAKKALEGGGQGEVEIKPFQVPPLSLKKNSSKMKKQQSQGVGGSLDNGVNAQGGGLNGQNNNPKMTKAAFVLQRRQQRDAQKAELAKSGGHLRKHVQQPQVNEQVRGGERLPQRPGASSEGGSNSPSKLRQTVLNSARSNLQGGTAHMSTGTALVTARSGGMRDLSVVAPMTNRPLESARRLRDSISQRERLNKMQQIQQQQQQQQKGYHLSNNNIEEGKSDAPMMNNTSGYSNMSVGPTLTSRR